MAKMSFDNTENAFKYKSDKELKRAQFLFSTMSSPNAASLGISLAKWVINWNLPFKGLIKKTIYEQFCGGENLKEISTTTQRLAEYKVGVCLDYGVEGAADEAAFDATVKAFEDTILFAANKDNIPFIPLKITGFGASEILEKVSAGTTLSEADNSAWLRIKQRIDKVCELCSQNSKMVLIDAEESWMQQAMDDLTDEMMEKYNKEKVVVFNTFQMYRHDRLAFIKASHKKAKEKSYLLGVKIVRGAYMEKERDSALEKGYLSPIQPNKEATDRDFNLAIDYCFENLNELALFIGTHNEASSQKGVDLLAAKGLPNNHPHIFFSQLYGMSDNITFNLAAEGYNASKYLPYGALKDVIPYLLRRAQENTSVAGQTSRELFLINKEIARRKSNKS